MHNFLDYTLFMSFKSSSAGLKRIKEQIKPVFKKHGVIKAAVFGSFARGEATKKSDLDLLIKFKGRKSLLDLVGLEQELSDKLEREVDVLTYGSINHLIKDRVIQEQILIL